MSSVWTRLIAEEQVLGATAVARWQTRFIQMKATESDLVRCGHWRGGPRTLLAAINVHHLELSLTAGLAWLLRPDGHHGLGSAVLRGLLAHLAVDATTTEAAVRVVLEEQRDQTRADLVVYGSDWTIVVESKTFAVEQDEQLDRLYRHWNHEPNPVFVFLARGRRASRTDRESRGQWRPLAWKDVSLIVRTAAAENNAASHGVYEYVETLEAYHHG